MTANRQELPLRTLITVAVLLWGLGVIVSDCASPISTVRSPYHLRIVEVRNTTDGLQTLKIEPTLSQQLGAATTFTGVLEPGEVKTLYLYHGVEYVVRILDAGGHNELTRNTFQMDRNLALVFAGDSIAIRTDVVVEFGEPTFADSLQDLDPFGIRSAGPIQPDTTLIRDAPPDNDPTDPRARF